MIRAIAIDDEPLALKVIEHFCRQADNIELEKTFTSTTDALKHLKKYPVDLLFLDIQMPTINGIDFYKNLKANVLVIFTTAYSEYAVEGFNVNAIDYLLKPFSFERFTAAVEKAKKELAVNVNSEENSYVTIRADYKLQRIAIEDIILIEGLDDYIKINIKDKSPITARLSMKSILTKLPESKFMRVHRSYIVPLSRVRSIYNKTVQIEDFVVPIGETYKEEVAKKFNT